MPEPWVEVGDGVLVRRHASAKLTCGLVLGAERCLVVDTRLTDREGRDLAAAVRRVTPLPWAVVNTHGHYDHCFGNSAFVPAELWAHAGAVTMLEQHGAIKRAHFAAQAAAAGEAELAADLAAVELVPPDRTFTLEHVLDLGGRSVALRHLGRGHTDHDVVVDVPDADAVLAGDLVEEGDPPAFADALPLDWPDTLLRVAALGRASVVPGHGRVVDEAFVRAQAALLADLASAARTGHAERRPAADVARDLPLPHDVATQAVSRAYRQLDGRPPLETPDELRARLAQPDPLD